MTYIPTVNNEIDENNSSTTLLLASQTFVGTPTEATRYTDVTVMISTDVPSAPLGIRFEFSQDNLNWDTFDAFTYQTHLSNFTQTVKVYGQWFRIRYVNGSVNQAVFRLQCKLETVSNDDDSKTGSIPANMVDGFNRLRISNPQTVLEQNHVAGKNPQKVYENISGLATSVHRPDSSDILMSVTGTGSVLRRTRKRAIYQPGKSLLVYMTGVLNNGSNDSTVTTKIGYYDDNDGYYFQYNNNVISIVERTSVSGSVVENVVNQFDWNVNRMNNFTTSNYNLDPSKALIFWFNLEWLGVGICDCGIVINKDFLTVHRFLHSNLLTTPYIRTASLPIAYEIISTGGSGSSTMICQTAISEGGHKLTGNINSVDMGTSTQNVSTTIEPLIVLRLKSGRLENVYLNNISVISSSNSNALIEIYRIVDTDASTILNNSTFTSVNAESAVEYNLASSSITLTSNAYLVDSQYFSNNNDTTNFQKNENMYMATGNGLSDLIAICATNVQGNDDFLASVVFEEVI